MRILLVILALFFCSPAMAACNVAGNGNVQAYDGSGDACVAGTLKIDQTTPGSTNAVAAGASKHLTSSVLTRIANSTTYTSATSTAPETICLFTSVTACAPLTLTVSTTATVNGSITGLQLFKSTTGATGATFRVYGYQAAPTLTGVFDVSTYTPLLADGRSAAFIGSWECASQNVNSDNSQYFCSANQTIGYSQFNLTDGTLRFVVLATGAYAPGSGETFSLLVDTLQSVP